MRRTCRFSVLVLLLGVALAFASQAGAQQAAPAPLARLAILHGDLHLPEGHSELAILSPEEEAPSDAQTPATESSRFVSPSSNSPHRREDGSAPPRSIDILLLIQRQNE